MRSRSDLRSTAPGSTVAIGFRCAMMISMHNGVLCRIGMCDVSLMCLCTTHCVQYSMQ